MAEQQAKKRVVILGGGVGSMATAWQLTSDENWRDRFESITVYQLGWRLGGKGASGRTRDGGRILEHGLHIWLGFYENSFQVIRQAYGELGRPPEAPLSTWRKAFTQHSFVGVDEQFEGEWKPWMFDFPTNKGTPGSGGELPTIAEYHEMVTGWIVEAIRDARGHHANEDRGAHRGVRGWLESTAHELGLGAEDLEVTAVALAAALETHSHRVQFASEHQGVLHELLARLIGYLVHELEENTKHDLEARRHFILIIMAATIALGMLRDEVLERGFAHLEGVDFATWLRQHGAPETICDLQKNPILRGLYDFVFAYEGGDVNRPNFAAGPALQTIFRMVFTYKGAIFWKMEAGMGDTIFTPFYLALKARGVEFKFFHRVKNLGLSADKTFVERITIGRQVTLKNGTYDPLVDVESLACWPAEPIYDQIVEGEELRKRGIDLESHWTPWEDVEEIALELSPDRDIVVFGISLGSVPHLCPELIDASDAWRKMVENVGTVRTLALQLWLEPDLAGLGWSDKSPVLDAWIEPLNTWADMTHLKGRESWPGDGGPGSISYFCGAMPDVNPPAEGPDAECAQYPLPGGVPPSSEHDFPARAYDYVTCIGDRLIDEHAGTLWPAGVTRDQILASFFRANIDPSERYSMSLAGSARYRLRANASGFGSLVLTGDWIDNGFNAGCVEASVWSGIQAANTVLGRPLCEGIVGIEKGWCTRAES